MELLHNEKDVYPNRGGLPVVRSKVQGGHAWIECEEC